jgi:hypothetical protein
MLGALDRPEKPMRSVDSKALVDVDWEARIVAVAMGSPTIERFSAMGRAFGCHGSAYVLQVSSLVSH